MPDQNFTLDQALADWRRKIMASGITATGLLAELESHLRDDIDAQIASGVTPQQAFEMAEARIGAPSELQTEFKNAGVQLTQEDPRMKRFFFTLAGIPQTSAAVAMDGTNPLIEPAWATYTKASLFLIPAILMWSFCGIFMVPKIEFMFRQNGSAVPEFQELSRWVFGLCGLSHLIFDNSSLIGIGALAILVALEYKAQFWSRYRRAAMGLSVMFINTAVLVLLTSTVVFALCYTQFIK